MTQIDIERITPDAAAETPDEIRRQRDLYRSIVEHDILEHWRGVRREDWNLPDGGRGEIEAMIADLRSELGRE
jgi:hypothetical protein